MSVSYNAGYTSYPQGYTDSSSIIVLSEEEMEQFKDVSKFSLDELESKLSILESRHRRASTKEQPKESTVTPSVTFNLDSEGQADIPDFVKALNAMKQKMN